MSNTTLPPEKVKEIETFCLRIARCSHSMSQQMVFDNAKKIFTEEAEKAHDGAQAQQLIIHQLSADLIAKDAEIERLKKEIEIINAKW